MKVKKCFRILVLIVLAYLLYLSGATVVNLYRNIREAERALARAEKHLEAGNKYYRLRDYRSAVAEYEKALGAHPARKGWLTAQENLLAAEKMLILSNNMHTAAFMKDASTDLAGTALMRCVTSFFSKKGRWPTSEREIREWCGQMGGYSDLESVGDVRVNETSNGYLRIEYSLPFRETKKSRQYCITVRASAVETQAPEP